MAEALRRDGVGVGRHRVRRLMRLMGLEALAPKPGTSRPAPGHRIYPYLLRGLTVERPADSGGSRPESGMISPANPI